MIPVSPQPEPAGFDATVRQPGLRWLARNAIALRQPLPAGTQVEPYWRKCLPDLHRSYSGICAYVCVHVELVTGGASVDHFVAKSRRPDLAYEWSNYRFACTKMNSRKRDFDTVLDPFGLAPDTFRLEMVTGRIYPNPALPPDQRTAAERTIEQLDLDDAECREARARHYAECAQGYYTAEFLKLRSPFVWYEAQRQGLL